MKFNRIWQMQVQAFAPGAPVPNPLSSNPLSLNPLASPGQGGNFYKIGSPLTLELDINRNMLAAANKGRFRIYNLAQSTRRALFHDRFDILAQQFQMIQLNAGYKTDATLPMVFFGNIFECGSSRETVDWHTDVDAFDGYLAMSNPEAQAQLTMPAGWTLQSVIRSLIASMGGSVSEGTINVPTMKNSRGISLAGNAWDVLCKLVDHTDDSLNGVYANPTCFIDNGKVNVLSEGSSVPVPGKALVISPDTGLLGAPVRQNHVVTVEMIFEPSVVVGMQVQLAALLDPANNGTYIVRGLRHHGVISDAVDGGCFTTLQLWNPNLGQPPDMGA